MYIVCTIIFYMYTVNLKCDRIKIKSYLIFQQVVHSIFSKLFRLIKFFLCKSYFFFSHICPYEQESLFFLIKTYNILISKFLTKKLVEAENFTLYEAI